MKTPLAQSLSPGGTPYANPRIRVAHQRLLSRDEIESYLHERNFDAFFKRLSEGPYAAPLATALLTHSGIEAVSSALATDLHTSYAWVYRLSNDHYRKLLTALAAKWDILDLKTIIRAKTSGVPLSSDRIAFLGIGAQIAPDAIKALSRQENITDVVNLALTWGLPYGEAFSEGLEAYSLKENVAQFELKLDHAYALWACSQLRGTGAAAQYARRVFGQWIDTLNIDTLIRLAETVDEIEKPLSYMLPGGLYLSKNLFASMITVKDITDLVEALGKVLPAYRAALSAGFGSYGLTGHLSEIERALEVRLIRQTIKEGSRDILGFGVALAYLTAKENETTNLGIIAHGIYRGVSPRIIEKDLVLV